MNCKELWKIIADLIFIPKMSLDFLTQKMLIARIIRAEKELFPLEAMEHSYFGVIKSITGTINEFKGSGCYPKDLANYGFGGNGKVFRIIFEKYQKWLDENNFFDEIDKCWAIVAKINCLSAREKAEFQKRLEQKLWPFEGEEDTLTLNIKGLRLRKVDQELIAALHLKGLVNISHVSPFAAQTCQNIFPKNVKVSSADNISAELKLAWQRVATLLEEKKIKPEETLLIVPDLRLYSPHFLTMAEIPMIKDLLVLLKVMAEGWQGDKILQILTSPFLNFRRGMSRQWITKNLSNLPPDCEIWREFIKLRKQATGHKRWDALNEALERIRETIEIFPKQMTMAEFIEEIFILINQRLVMPRSYNLAFNGDLVLNAKAYNLLIEILRGIQNTCNSLNLSELLTKESLYQEFRTLLLEMELRLNIKEQIEISDLNNLKNGDIELEKYQTIFVLGLAEGIWPKRRSNSWLINESDRTEQNRRGFWNRSKKILEQEEEEIFQKILKSPVGSIYLYFPQKVTGKLLGPSSFLSKYLPAETMLKVREDKNDGHLMKEKPNLTSNVHKECQSYKHQREIIKSQERNLFSVSEINTYAYCPAMYLFRYLWGLKEEVRETDLLNIHLGKICHRVLEYYLRTGGEKEQKIAGVSLENLIVSSLKEFRANNLFLLPTFYHIIEKTCFRYLNNWAARNWQNEKTISDNIRERMLEWSFGLEDSAEAALELQGKQKTVKLKGQIDRIDIDNQSKVIIYDYKLGKQPEVKAILNQEELQVPLYLLAFKKLKLKEDYQVVGGAYYSLKKGLPVGIWLKESKDRSLVGKSKDGDLTSFEWEKFFLDLEVKVLDTVESIRSKQFPRRSDFGKECFRLCAYRSICNS